MFLSIINYDDKIAVKGIDALKTIHELEMCVSPNNHASMRVTGIINQETGYDYIEHLLEDKAIQIVELGEQEKNIFDGLIIDTTIKETNGLFNIEVKGISGSYMLDMEKKSRSFQNTKLTYEQLIGQVIKDTSNSDAIFEVGSEQIAVPIIQYRETDWEFIKRMASHYADVVVPEITTAKPRFWFGMRNGKNKELTDVMEYRVWKDIDSFNDKGGEIEGYIVNDFLFYEVKTWQDFEIGDIISFKDKEMVVCSINGKMEKGLWVYTYVLGFKQAVGLKKKYNSIISGMSIKGTVLDTKGERLKVHLDIDKSQDKSTAYWYPYVPTSGNMMYCMPKVGTQVVLYFPDEKEQNARITGCVRTNGGDCKDIADPKNRYFTTEHNKQMALLPDMLSFSGVGNEQSPLMISMQEKGKPGISLESHKAIKIFAKGNIDFSSDKKIVCTAVSSISAGKYEGELFPNPQSVVPKSTLYIKYEFNILTKTVKIITTRFENYPPFDDAPKAFSKKKFWCNLLIAVAVVAVVAVLAVVTFGTGPIVLGAIAGAAIGVAFKAKDNWDKGDEGSVWGYMAKAIGGAVCGAIGGVSGGFLATVGLNALGSVAGVFVEDVLDGGGLTSDIWDYGISAFAGGLGSALGYGITAGIKQLTTGALKNMTSNQAKVLINKYAKIFGERYAKKYAGIAGENAASGASKWMYALAIASREGNESFFNRFTNLTLFNRNNYALNTSLRELKDFIIDEYAQRANLTTIKRLVTQNPDIFQGAAFELLNPLVKAFPSVGGNVLTETTGNEGQDIADKIVGPDDTKSNPDETPQDGARYLARGGKLKCKCGSHSRMVNLPTCHGTYTTDQPILCKVDDIPQNGPEDAPKGKNVMIFGACSNPSNQNENISYQVDDGVDRKGKKQTKKVDGKKCTPILLGGWKKYKSDVLINNSCALTTESWLQCQYGGIITVEDSGQVIEEK